MLLAPESHTIPYEDQDIRVPSVVNLSHTTEAMHTRARPSIVYFDTPGNLRSLDPKKPAHVPASNLVPLPPESATP